jgi:methionyl-tRNA formyltransferase
MWLDEGIDTGKLIATDVVKFTGDESLFDVHLKVMDAAHQLYGDAVEVILKDPALCAGVPQNSIAEGKTYYTKMWDMAAKKRLVHNFKHFKLHINNPAMAQHIAGLTLISLPTVH